MNRHEVFTYGIIMAFIVGGSMVSFNHPEDCHKYDYWLFWIGLFGLVLATVIEFTSGGG